MAVLLVAGCAGLESERLREDPAGLPAAARVGLSVA